MRISVPDGGAARTAAQNEMRDRRDARQRLAAEAERRDSFQVLRPPDLAGRVAFDGQPRILGFHPFAVVFDVNQLLAAELDRDRHAPRAGVDRVFDQLLDHRGRALDDFARRNLVREIAGKDLDATHVYSQPLRRKNASITAAIADHAARRPTRTASPSPPGNAGSGTFMPHIPVSTVSGRKIVDMTVRTFITHVEAVRDRREVRLEDARHPVLQQRRFVGQPDEVVVDVAEPIGQLVVDDGKLAARQTADRVALRNQRPAAATRDRA